MVEKKRKRQKKLTNGVHGKMFTNICTKNVVTQPISIFILKIVLAAQRRKLQMDL